LLVLKAERLLVDEQDGRDAAQRLGIRVAGTLAVLKDAALAGLINLREMFDCLRRTSFRASLNLYERILTDYEREREVTG